MAWTAPQPVARRFLWRRRWKRRIFYLTSAAVAGSVVFAHARPGRGLSDWDRFQRRAIRIVGVIDGQTLTVSTDSDRQPVRLIGIVAPAGHEVGASAAIAYLRTVALNRPATLLLDWPQTRDEHGQLLAFVYLADDDLLNADAVRDGADYAERRTSCLLQEPITAAEKAARKAKRGMWRDLRWDQTPHWRRQWFATRPQP